MIQVSDPQSISVLLLVSERHQFRLREHYERTGSLAPTMNFDLGVTLPNDPSLDKPLRELAGLGLVHVNFDVRNEEPYQVFLLLRGFMVLSVLHLYGFPRKVWVRSTKNVEQEDVEHVVLQRVLFDFLIPLLELPRERPDSTQASDCWHDDLTSPCADDSDVG